MAKNKIKECIDEIANINKRLDYAELVEDNCDELIRCIHNIDFDMDEKEQVKDEVNAILDEIKMNVRLMLE